MSDRIETDAVLHRFMLANNLEKPGHEVDLEGPLYLATREKQREELDGPHALAAGLGEAGKHVLAETLFHKTCTALGLVGTAVVMTGVETVVKNLETIHEGDVLKDAVKREYAVGAALVLCASALPENFGPSLQLEVVGKGAMRDDGALRLLRAIEKSPEFAPIQEGLISNCRDGQRYLIDRHIGTQAELSIALNHNPEFAARYRHDLAFKLGVDSVVWASAHDALPGLENQLPAAPKANQVEVRG